MMITLSYYVYSSLVPSKRIVIMLLVYLIISVGVVFLLLIPCRGLPICMPIVCVSGAREWSAKGEHQRNDVSAMTSVQWRQQRYICMYCMLYVWSNHSNVWCCTCSFFIQPLAPNNHRVFTITINTYCISSVDHTIVIVSSRVCPAGIH